MISVKEAILRIKDQCHARDINAYLHQQGSQTEPLALCTSCQEIVGLLVALSAEEEGMQFSTHAYWRG